MCYPVIFVGMSAAWSMFSSLTILDLWNPLLEPTYSLSPHVRAAGIMLFSVLQFSTSFVNLLCLISSSTNPEIVRFRSFKQLWISLVDAAFDIMVAGAILNGVSQIAEDDPLDMISVTMLVHLGTVTGLCMEILEFIVEVMMIGVDEGYSQKGAYCTFCVSNTQIFGSNFQCAIMLYLLSNVTADGDAAFVGIGITVLVILEICILSLCALTVWHQLAGCLLYDVGLDDDDDELHGNAGSVNTSVPFSPIRIRL